MESIDLITASILSKKLASGLDALILDVKAGGGAFMASEEEGRALAASLVDVANGAGCRTAALLTDMNEPLASAAGNAVEIRNACDFLTGKSIDPRLWDVTVALGGELLSLASAAVDDQSGRARIEDAFRSGAAAEKFARMTEALGGPADFMERYDGYLAAAPVVRDAPAPQAGHIVGVDARAIGVAVIELGGGRRDTSDAIDHRVGFDRLQAVGARLEQGAPLARVHAADDAAADHAIAAIQAAYRIGDQPVGPGSTVLDRVG